MQFNLSSFIKTVLLLIIFNSFSTFAQVTVGNGSYTTTFPGTDSAGRNQFPSGSPQLSGNAVGKPVPTNDWWSRLIKEDHADNLFNYPMTMKTTNQGLIVTYIPWGSIGDYFTADAINIYPNPIESTLQIQSSNNDLTKVEIYSLLGKKLIETTTELHTVNVDKLSSGIYLVKIYAEDKHIIKKIFKK